VLLDCVGQATSNLLDSYHSTHLPHRMSPRSSSQDQSPLPKRLQAPLPPSPHRTTSQVSAVSVKAHATDDHRPLLSQSRGRTRSASAPLSPKPLQPSLISRHSGSSSSELTAHRVSTGEGSVSRETSLAVGTSGVPVLSVASRKGKERAVGVLEESVARGHVTGGGAGGEDAARGLRRLVRRGTIGDGSRKKALDEGTPTADVHVLKPLDSESISSGLAYSP
jgi:hypothetical protein